MFVVKLFVVSDSSFMASMSTESNILGKKQNTT